MSKETKDFSKSLVNKMNEKKLRKANLAKMIDVSDTTVSRYVKGETKPKPLLLKRMAKVLGCSTDDLYKY